MKNCVVCGKDISVEEIACPDCIDFFVWKHKKNFAKRIINFRIYDKERFDSRSTKFRRLYK